MVLHDLIDVPTLDELSRRIKADIDHFGGLLPERYAIAWRGYLAGLSEWGVISTADHNELWKMLPEIGDPDPVDEIMIGRNNDEAED